MVSWSQLDEIRRSGIEIGAHTATHAALDLLSLEERETRNRRLEARFGRSIGHCRFELRVSLRLSECRRSADRAARRLFFRLRRSLRDEFARRRPICPLETHCTRQLGSRRVGRRIARPAASHFRTSTSKRDRAPGALCANQFGAFINEWPVGIHCNLRLHAGSLGRYRRCDCIGACSNIAGSGNHRCRRPQSRTAGSSDKTFTDITLRRQSIHTRSVRRTQHRHFAGAWQNRSISRRRCDCGPGLARKMIVHFDRPEVIGVGSRSLPMWLGERPSWFPDEFLWVVGCSYRACRKRRRPCATVSAAPCVSGAPLFENISGFNPSLGRGKGALLLSGEETELCLRATNLIEGSDLHLRPRLIHLSQGLCQTPQLAIFHQTMLRRRRLEGVSLKTPSFQAIPGA